MSHLRAVPQPARRIVGYVRVSQEGGRGDDLVSPAIQRDAIDEYCRRQGYTLIDVVEDIDKTGRLWRNRQIELIVDRIERGEVDGVVAWKLSRITRNHKDAEIAIDRIESIGGVLESATEPNGGGSMGGFNRRMNFALAQMESERIGEGWQAAHAQRTKQGLPHTGPQRPGYRYVQRKGTDPTLPGRGVYVIDPGQAPIIVELFRRYLAGAGTAELAGWLAAEGITGRSGRPLLLDGVRDYLASGWPAGYRSEHNPECRRPNDKGFLVPCRNPGGRCKNRVRVPGAHEPIIDAQTWARTLEEIERRSSKGRRAVSPRSKLSGICVCMTCGRPMQLQPGYSDPRTYYQCGAKRPRLDGCAAPSRIRRDAAEALVQAWLQDEALPDLERFVAERSARAVDVAQERTRLKARIGKVDDKLDQLLERALEGWDNDRVERVAGKLRAERDVLVEELARVADADELRGAADALPTVLQYWEDGASQEVSALLRPLLRVEVRNRREMEVVPAWRWT